MLFTAVSNSYTNICCKRLQSSTGDWTQTTKLTAVSFVSKSRWHVILW